MRIGVVRKARAGHKWFLMFVFQPRFASTDVSPDHMGLEVHIGAGVAEISSCFVHVAPIVDYSLRWLCYTIPTDYISSEVPILRAPHIGAQHMSLLWLSPLCVSPLCDRFSPPVFPNSGLRPEK